MRTLTADEIEASAMEPVLLDLKPANDGADLTLFYSPRSQGYTIYQGTKLVGYSPLAGNIAKQWAEAG